MKPNPPAPDPAVEGRRKAAVEIPAAAPPATPETGRPAGASPEAGPATRRRLLFILPGVRPSANLSRFEALSRRFEGDILSSRTYSEPVTDGTMLGRFRVHIFGSRIPLRHLASLVFLLDCLRFGLRARRAGIHYDLVLTYDPLKTGLFGVLTSRLLRTRFAPEVNGVYTSPAVYLDEPSRLRAALKRGVFSLLERWVLKRADGIKTLFPEQLDPFLPVVRGKKIRTFPAFIDIHHFDNIQVEEKPEILFIGFPFKLKGVDLLIDAFKLLAPQFPEWHLKILGWYPDPRELLSRIGGHPRIHHHLPVAPHEVPEHIGGCSIFTLPSRTEAMGRVLVESMAAGKPRVGARVDGIPTVIEDGVDGFLFAPGDHLDLADKLRRLMEDPALRRRMGEAGRRRAQVEFTLENYMKHLVEFYDHVLE